MGGWVERVDGRFGSRIDVIIYATDFHGHAYARPMKVFGVDGIDLDEV